MTASAAPLTSSQQAAILELVEQHFGIRGSEYGASRLDEAVACVLPATGHADAAAMLGAHARSSGVAPKWLDDLVEYLTIGETYFLRDPAQIAALRETILPDLLLRRSAERRLRLWSAGCSTGEEPYTLAILLMEKHLADWDVQLMGTDLNRESLRIAREGSYPAWSFRATPDYVRDRYFEPADSTKAWRLIEPIRRMARFTWMNLGAEVLMPPANDLDLIVCRNVTIYFDDAATQRLYQTLIRALAPGGWLMLGPSDPLPVERSDLERVEVSETVLWRRRMTPAVAPRGRGQGSAVRGQSEPKAAHTSKVGGQSQKGKPSTDVLMELEEGLLAMEAGAFATALDALRRATFRDPSNAVGQFALARAYLAVDDPIRAHAALIHTRRLIAPLAADALVPGSDALPVETLRQAIHTYLDGLAA